MRLRWLLIVLAACGDNKFGGVGTPEQIIANATEGQQVEVTGEVHTVTFDSTQVASRRAQLALHPNDSRAHAIQWILQQDDEEKRGKKFAFDDAGAQYPRLTDRYILIRTVKPSGIAMADDNFDATKLADAWGLGIHLPDLAPGVAMPEVGTTIKVTGTFHRVVWNGREDKVPIIDQPTITVISGPPDLKSLGATCALDQECSARLICDRATTKCAPPPREIYWADPFHDVNGACTTDADCPLGQLCDLTHTIAAAGEFVAFYFPAQDIGRHLCRLVPGATVASQCPRIYTTRDLAGGRFVTGKEVCVRATLFLNVPAEDNDTHDQMVVDEPIPYPDSDSGYNLFGATTENGPVYKDPTLAGGPVVDPVEGQEVIAIGTYRYDPDHGWHEVHPVKAYLPPP